MFCFFVWEACGFLDPWPGIEPASPALKGEASTTGPPGKTSMADFYLKIDTVVCLPPLNNSLRLVAHAWNPGMATLERSWKNLLNIKSLLQDGIQPVPDYFC